MQQYTDKKQYFKVIPRLNSLTAMSRHVFYLENCHQNRNQETYQIMWQHVKSYTFYHVEYTIQHLLCVFFQCGHRVLIFYIGTLVYYLFE